MSDQSKPQFKNTEALSEEDLKNFNPDNLYVNMGGRQVPFSAIRNPRVVVHPKDHQPQGDPKDFPDLTPEARAHDAEREAKKQAADTNN